MDQNTFTAGVEPGGLTDHILIKILICHVLSSLEFSIHHEDLMGALTERGQANYFECANALVELLASGVIYQDEEQRYSILQLGREIVDVLGVNGLPFTVKEKVMASALELQRKSRNRNTHSAHFLDTGDGILVRCEIRDHNQRELFALEIEANSQIHAERIHDNFMAKAQDILHYCTLMLAEEEY